MRFSNQDENAGNFKLLPQGEYEFRVDAAEDAVSKNGNEMIKLTLSIQGEDRVHLLWDYLVPKMAYKICHFCRSIGKEDLWESGEFSSKDCIGASGRCLVSIEPPTDNYKEKNVVSDYVSEMSAEDQVF